MDINQYYLNNSNYLRKNQYGQYVQYYNYYDPSQPAAMIHHQLPPSPSPQQQQQQTNYLPSIIETIHYYDNRNTNYNNKHFISPPPTTVLYPIQSPLTSVPHGYGYHHHRQHQQQQQHPQQSNLRNSSNFKSMYDMNSYVDSQQPYSININYKQNGMKLLNDSDEEDINFFTQSSSSSYSTYSSSSSSSTAQGHTNANAGNKEDEKEEDSLIAQSIQCHDIEKLNENFKKLISKPYNYYFNDSVFNHVHEKSGDSNNDEDSNSKNNDDNDITLNNNTILDHDVDGNDSLSESSSDTNFSRYAPADDENDF